MNKNIRVLSHILEYCNDIQEDADRIGNSYETFKGDKLYQKAITMSMLQIGELTTHLSEDFKSSTNEEMDWRNIKGLRNILAHNYGSIDFDIIWEIKDTDIPRIKEFCEQAINTLENCDANNNCTDFDDDDEDEQGRGR